MVDEGKIVVSIIDTLTYTLIIMFNLIEKLIMRLDLQPLFCFVYFWLMWKIKSVGLAVWTRNKIDFDLVTPEDF